MTTQHTPNLALPYPEGTDKPAGNQQIEELAAKVDSTCAQAVGGFTTPSGTEIPGSSHLDSYVKLPLSAAWTGGGAAAPTVANGAITINADGVYSLSFNVLSGNSGGNSMVGVLCDRLDGALPHTRYITQLTGNSQQQNSISGVPLKKGDTITLAASVTVTTNIADGSLVTIARVADLPPAGFTYAEPGLATAGN